MIRGMFWMMWNYSADPSLLELKYGLFATIAHKSPFSGQGNTLLPPYALSVESK